MKEKDKNKQKKAEPCPLCKVSEETIKRLKEGKDKKAKDRPTKNNERSKNRK